MDRKTHKIMLCIPSATTRVSLVSDDVDNGGDGFSVSHMRISKLYYRRGVGDANLLKCINIKINNIGTGEISDSFNTVYFYDGVNVPTTKYFANIICDNADTSAVSYECSGDRWDFVNKRGQSDNVKDIEISVYDAGTALCGGITVDNRMYLELEFF